MNSFNRFADNVARHVAHSWFFIACVLLVLLWIPTLFFLEIDLSQLLINTATTIITFLLVALLHNSEHRFEEATNKRFQELLDAIKGIEDPVDDPGQKPMSIEVD